jgi:hypothetical protein
MKHDRKHIKTTSCNRSKTNGLIPDGYFIIQKLSMLILAGDNPDINLIERLPTGSRTQTTIKKMKGIIQCNSWRKGRIVS